MERPDASYIVLFIVPADDLSIGTSDQFEHQSGVMVVVFGAYRMSCCGRTRICSMTVHIIRPGFPPEALGLEL